MHRIVIAAIDWKRQWARVVLSSPEGVELTRTRWRCQEAASQMLDYLCQQRELFGVPVVVAWRCNANWPDDLWRLLSNACFPIELYHGAPLGRLLRLERKYREDLSYRGAALLAAICIARYLGRKQEAESFVAQWCHDLAQQRVSELRAELQAMAWSEEEAIRPPQNVVNFRYLACLRMRPVEAWNPGGQP